MGASLITANLSSSQSSNLVSESSRLQEYPIFTAVSTTRHKEAGLKGGGGGGPWQDFVVAFSGHNTFFVPGQHPHFDPSLLEESNRLRNAFLKPVLYRRHSQKLQNININICF